MNVPAKTLWHKLYFGIDEMPSWNPTVLEAKILKASNKENSIVDWMECDLMVFIIPIENR